ncbi:DUF4377 domain-containing protein [Myroides sp. M-43]|uniref:DUF4377 domain-containing protein n=1 Tax=Myroides oncorhynchi TaxID=2893756 RepID=UPI001E57586F|nr:DUF4377 domain-containing protein [Myroides oncorhynchi]MCC9043619.1 DUF4377 domain-containing protein [Myroides oncorhynchi]
MKKILLLLALTGTSFVSCKKSTDIKTSSKTEKTSPSTEFTQTKAKKELPNVIYTIASKLVDCTGVGPMKCMQYKEEGSDQC